MRCPRCQYELEPFESECPRCKHLGAAAAPAEASPVPEARRTPDTWFALKRMAGGILALIAACWLGNYFLGKPTLELTFVLRGQVAPGFILSAREETESVETGDGGFDEYPINYIDYAYRLPNGIKITQTSPKRYGSLTNEWRNLKQPYPITVEYLPDHPEVSRIKGDGCESVIGWIFTRALVTVFFGTFFVWLGILLVRDGYRRLREGDTAEETYE